MESVRASSCRNDNVSCHSNLLFAAKLSTKAKVSLVRITSDQLASVSVKIRRAIVLV